MSSQSQQEQQPQPVNPRSAYIQMYSSLPLLRDGHTTSTSPTAPGQLTVFGGYVHRFSSPSNDLYVISTRDFSSSFLQTSGDIPSPRFGHCAVLTSTTLFIWGGKNKSSEDSLYLLDLASRDWTCIKVNGSGPVGRYYHTMTLIDSKLFVFGGKSAGKYFNDIWALDLNCLKSNPHWESYEPAPGDEKPLPRAAHVSVTTNDHIIIFGGSSSSQTFNDTWSFDISTRKWTELQCRSTPSPRAGHAAVLVNDDMYVFGGRAPDGTNLGDLTALNLSTQQWTTSKDSDLSPHGRSKHAMAYDGRRVFVLGGLISVGTQAALEFDPELLVYPKPKPDSDSVKLGEKTTQFTQKLSVGHSTRGQPHQPSSSSDAHAAHGTRTPRFQKAAMRSRPRRVPKEGDGGEGSTEHRVMELEQQLSKIHGANAQLTDRIEKAEANLVEEKERVRGLQSKVDELMPPDHELQPEDAGAQNAWFYITLFAMYYFRAFL